MPVPSKTWSDIADSQVAPNAPGDTILMTEIRDNLIHLEEWLGFSYTAAQDHNHDNVNSKAVGAIATDAVTQDSIANSAVGQGELKTTTGEVSSTSTTQLTLTMPGGEYGFYPQIKMSSTSSIQWDARMLDSNGINGWTNYLTVITLWIGAAGPTLYAQQRYIQSSPPYKIGDKGWGHFFFVLQNISTDEVVASYEAADPCWAYNGPRWNDKDSKERIEAVPHPFVDYWGKDPADDGLEISLIDLSDINIEDIKKEASKKKKGTLEIMNGLNSKGEIIKPSDIQLSEIKGFTDKVKIRRR